MVSRPLSLPLADAHERCPAHREYSQAQEQKQRGGLQGVGKLVTADERALTRSSPRLVPGARPWPSVPRPLAP
jgi:hypothetical protein